MPELDVLVGDPLVVNCTLLEDYPNINSTWLYFKLGDTAVPEESVTRPDSRTIQLNTTANMNMSSSHLYCHAKNVNGRDTTVAHSLVEVHSKYFANRKK